MIRSHEYVACSGSGALLEEAIEVAAESNESAESVTSTVAVWSVGGGGGTFVASSKLLAERDGGRWSAGSATCVPTAQQQLPPPPPPF